MEPDRKNTWMDADVGKHEFIPPPPVPVGPVRPMPTHSPTEELMFGLTRIVFALLMAAHGAQKVFGLFGGVQSQDPVTLAVGSLELGCGVAVALGIFTRPLAFLLCLDMAVVYVTTRFGVGVWPVGNAGEVLVLYCFFFLYVAARGAGTLSIDGLRASL